MEAYYLSSRCPICQAMLCCVFSCLGTQYFARIEDLRRSPSFISACAQLGPPPPLTRTLLAALVSEDAAASAALHDDHAHDAAGTLIANGHASVHANARVAGMWPGESPYDSDLSALLGGLVERVKGRTMDMFSRPAANTVSWQGCVCVCACVMLERCSGHALSHLAKHVHAWWQPAPCWTTKVHQLNSHAHKAPARPQVQALDGVCEMSNSPSAILPPECTRAHACTQL